MIGVTPFGTGAYGLDTVDPIVQSKPIPLLDENNIQQGSRYVDASTGDYVFSGGLPIGEDNLHHRVRLAVLTLRDSSVDRELGAAPIGSVITDAVRLKRIQDIREALSRLVRERRIEIVSVDVDITTRPVTTTIQWRDLQSNSLQESKV